MHSSKAPSLRAGRGGYTRKLAEVILVVWLIALAALLTHLIATVLGGEV